MSHRNPILQPKKSRFHTKYGNVGLLRQTIVIMMVVAIAQGFVLYQCFVDTPLAIHRMWTIGVATISCPSFLWVMMVLDYVKTKRIDTTTDSCAFLGIILSAGLIIVDMVPDAIYRSSIVAAALVIALSWMVLISLVLSISMWKTEDRIIDEIDGH